jgi:hypothetical protein
MLTFSVGETKNSNNRLILGTNINKIMKKLFLVGFLALSLAFTSCSSDSDESTPPTPVEVCFEITAKSADNGSYLLISHPAGQPAYQWSVSQAEYDSYSVGQDYCTTNY